MNKKVAPNVQDPTINRALNEIYDTLNELLSSSNFNTDDSLVPSSGKIGDFKVIKDFQTKRYKIAGKGRDGWVTSPGYLQTGTGGIELNQAQFDLTKYDDINYKDTVFSILNEKKGETTSLKLGTLANPTLLTVDKAGDFTLDVSGDITFDADGGQVYIKDGGNNHFAFDCDDTKMTIYDDTTDNDYFYIQTAANGATKLSTIDSDGAVGHLNIAPDGHIQLQIIDGEQDAIEFLTSSNKFGSLYAEDGAHSTFKLYENGGESTNDYCTLYVEEHGATVLRTLDATANAANLTLRADGQVILDTNSTSKEILFKSVGTEFGRVEAHHGASYFRLLENAGASSDDFFEIKCEASGVTTILTQDGSPGAAANLLINADGNIEIKANTGLIEFEDTGLIISDFYNDALSSNQFRLYTPGAATNFFKIATGLNGATTISTTDAAAAAANLTLALDGDFIIKSSSSGGTFFKEAASAAADRAGYGQIWIKDDSPNNLYFTNDSGNDVQITDGSSLAGGSGSSSFVVNDFGRWQMTTANDHYGGYSNYYIRSTDFTGALSQGTADTSVYSWYASRYGYIIPVDATVTHFLASCELQLSAGNNSDVTVNIWKYNATANAATTTTALTVDHIGSITFSDPSDSTYIHATQTCGSLDGSAKVFSAGDTLMITASKAGGSDSTYYYIKSAIRFTEN